MWLMLGTCYLDKNETSFWAIGIEASEFAWRYADKFSTELRKDFVCSRMALQVMVKETQEFV